jgi:hypothetical protein
MTGKRERNKGITRSIICGAAESVEVKMDGVSIRIALVSDNVAKLAEQSNVSALDAWMAKHAR